MISSDRDGSGAVKRGERRELRTLYADSATPTWTSFGVEVVGEGTNHRSKTSSELAPSSASSAASPIRRHRDFLVSAQG